MWKVAAERVGEVLEPVAARGAGDVTAQRDAIWAQPVRQAAAIRELTGKDVVLSSGDYALPSRAGAAGLKAALITTVPPP